MNRALVYYLMLVLFRSFAKQLCIYKRYTSWILRWDCLDLEKSAKLSSKVDCTRIPPASWVYSCMLIYYLSSLARCVFQSLPNFKEVLWYNLSQFLFQICVLEMALVVKNPLTNTGNIGDAALTPWLGGSPGGRCGNRLQYSCLENPMDRGAWQVTVHRVTKSQTWLK